MQIKWEPLTHGIKSTLLYPFRHQPQQTSKDWGKQYAHHIHHRHYESKPTDILSLLSEWYRGRPPKWSYRQLHIKKAAVARTHIREMQEVHLPILSICPFCHFGYLVKWINLVPLPNLSEYLPAQPYKKTNGLLYLVLWLAGNGYIACLFLPFDSLDGSG